MEKNLRELQQRLYQEALSLRDREIEHYRSINLPEEHWGFARFLEEIADKINQAPPGISWLEENEWGIYRVVSDGMEGMQLGKDLLNFSLRIKEFIAMYKSKVGG